MKIQPGNMRECSAALVSVFLRPLSPFGSSPIHSYLQPIFFLIALFFELKHFYFKRKLHITNINGKLVLLDRITLIKNYIQRKQSSASQFPPGVSQREGCRSEACSAGDMPTRARRVEAFSFADPGRIRKVPTRRFR